MKSKALIILVIMLILLPQAGLLWADGRNCTGSTDIRDFCNNNASNSATGNLTNWRGTTSTTLEGPDVSSYQLLALITFWLDTIIKYLRL